MAKRFTDTEKWRDEWYLSLDNDSRIVWQYILDNCTIAGRFKKAFKMLNFCCNTNLDENQFIKLFEGRVVDCGKFFFIPKFLKFQYPKGLCSYKPAIVAVREELKEHNLTDMVKELFGNGYLTIKDKDKDKDKYKDKDKDTYKDIVETSKPLNSGSIEADLAYKFRNQCKSPIGQEAAIRQIESAVARGTGMLGWSRAEVVSRIEGGFAKAESRGRKIWDVLRDAVPEEKPHDPSYGIDFEKEFLNDK